MWLTLPTTGRPISGSVIMPIRSGALGFGVAGCVAHGWGRGDYSAIIASVTLRFV